MKHVAYISGLVLSLSLACTKQEAASENVSPSAGTAPAASELPPVDATNIVSIASNSKDHTTLVTALKAADYVRSVSNAGPFTVFAPTNAAFAKLPAGTVEGLLKPEKSDDLREVLKYHVTTSTYPVQQLKDGQILAMANGKKATVHVAADNKVKINDATIIASVPASNGMVHVVDAVLLPPAP